MLNNLTPLLIGVALLVMYLVLSAATEMGTRWPWLNPDEHDEPQ
jgi:hypothetical protein